jgi:glycosyltransferase involved in cell wall biosynthesis
MSLGLVMIARDAADGIERALASVRGCVDDMLVLDTGSVDATPELARRAGARVQRFEWIDDFSAARNAALAASASDWHFVLDADEWLAEGAAALRRAAAREPAFIGLVAVDSESDNAGTTQHCTSWLPRLLPRGARYAGRIHEQPQSALPRERLDIVLGHDGYRDTALKAKDGRNLRLLQRALQDAPHDAYLLYQLGRDHEVHARYADALRPYREALAAAPAEAAWRHDLVVRALFTLKMSRRHAEAMQLAEREMPRWQRSPDFFFALGDLLLDWAAEEPARAPELLPMIEAAWQRCLAIGENPSLEGAVAGRGSHLAAHNLDLLRQTLAGLV